MYLAALLLLWIAGIRIAGVAADERDLAAPSRANTSRTAGAAICCPLSWSLVKIDAGVFRADRYECRNAIDAHADADVELYEQTAPVYGYRIQQPRLDDAGAYNGSIPQCSRQSLVYIDGNVAEVELPASACLLSVERRPAAIYCPPRSDERLRALNVVHKCCPLRYVYDGVQRRCVQRSVANYARYGQLLPQTAIFVDGAVECGRDKVLVEYHLGASKLKYIDGKLALTSQGVWHKFALDDYCVEAIEERQGEQEEVEEGWRRRQAGNAAPLVETKYLVRTCNPTRLCLGMACIRRCCADGELFTKGNATSYCKKDETDVSFHSFDSLQISGNFTKPPVFGILRGLDCLKFRLDPDSYSDESHTINSNDGALFVASTMKNYTNSQYCVEKIRNASWGEQKLYTFLCFDSKVVGNEQIRFKMYPIGLLISCSFYAITLVVYLSISRLRNLPGQILICLVINLFAAYLGIALGQLIPTNDDNMCFASGYFIYFCLMAAFAWMNVMCFDIWQTFGSAKKKRGFQQKDTRRFLLYSLYGWGLPTLMTAITVSFAKSDVLSEGLRPDFKQGRCWFTYGTLASANLIFFSGPIGVLFLINLVLFLLTLRYCNRVKREIFRMQSSNVEKPVLRRRFFVDKARFAMNTKLFIVMGITWLLELLSILLYDRKKVFFWVISDSFNVLLGVFVFFIFVFKKRIWHSLLVKIGIRSKESLKTLPHATCATQSTYAPHSMSMTRLNAIEGNLSLLCNAAKN